MKKLILLLALIIFSPLVVHGEGNPYIIGSCVGGSVCAQDVIQITYANDSLYLYDNQAAGQSFQVSQSGRLCKVTLLVRYIGTTPDATIYMRAGTSEDLSSSYVTSNGVLTSGLSVDTEVEFIFPSGEDLNMVTSTSYFFAVNNSASYNNRIEFHDYNSIYANGQSWRASSSGWDMSGGGVTDDAYFRVFMD